MPSCNQLGEKASDGGRDGSGHQLQGLTIPPINMSFPARNLHFDQDIYRHV